MSIALEQPIVQKKAPQQNTLSHPVSSDGDPLTQHIVISGQWEHFKLIQQGFEHSGSAFM